MNLLKILQEIDDVIYETCLWLVLVPKTFFRIIVKPGWMKPYVHSQVEMKPDNRFDDYLSPIIFWILVGVLPYYFAVEMLRSNHPDNLVVKAFGKMNIESKISSLTVFFVTFPMAAAFGIHIFKKEAVTKTNLKKIFYTQCYCFAPLQLFFVPYFMVLNGNTYTVLEYSLLLIGSLYFYWFAYSQLLIIREELKVGWLRAVGVGIIMYFLIVFLLAVGEVFIIGLNWKSLHEML